MKREWSSATTWLLMPILSCLVIWAAHGRAQTDDQRPTRHPASQSSTGISTRRPNEVDRHRYPSVPFKQTDSSLASGSGRKVVSLVEPDGQAPIGDTAPPSRQIIDLRPKAVSPQTGRGSQADRVAVRLDQEQTIPPRDTKSWVDSAIPQWYFDEAQMEKSEADQSPIKLPKIESGGIDQYRSSESSAPAATKWNSDAAVPGTGFAPEHAIPDWILHPDGQLPQKSEMPQPPDVLPFPPDLSGQGTPHEPISPLPYRPGNNMFDRVPPGDGQTLGKRYGQSETDSGVGTGGGSIGGIRSGVGSDSSNAATSTSNWPVLTPSEYFPARVDAFAQKTDYYPDDFSPSGGPQGSTFDPLAASLVYRGKFAVPVQRPLVELWRPLYTSGIYPPALTWFGVTNPMKPHFLVYGDMRTAVGSGRNAAGNSNLWGNVLNLDMDLQLTSTERIHAFVSPLSKGTRATGLSFNDDVQFLDSANFDLLTLFFEGDLGALAGGASGRYPPFDLPFTFGLIPLIYQNGIWANDAVLGAAVALPARHNRWLKWSNFDATFFWATDNVTTDAFRGQDSAADFFGSAWFIDAYDGYIEAGYAFVNDNAGGGRSYHNMAFAFTRRYLARLSNSVRFIINVGQDNLAKADRTADGHLLLIENSFITAYPNTIVPYVNFFYGQGRPQSLARVGFAGGILNNTGINFETDGITDFPTLDATGHNTYGLAAGINLLGSQFSHQLVLEMAMLQAVGSPQFRNAEGDQYAVGLRYQKPLSHNLIFRTDHMLGFRQGASDLNGSRLELRWKF